MYWLKNYNLFHSVTASIMLNVHPPPGRSQGNNGGPIRNRKIDLAPAGLAAFTSGFNDCRLASSVAGAIT